MVALNGCGESAAAFFFNGAVFLCKRHHCEKHPCLGPTHIRRADRTRPQDPVVEETPIIPELLHTRLQHGACECDVPTIELFDCRKRDHALCDRMNIDRVGTIVKIFCCAVLEKEVLTVEPDSASQMS